MLEPAAAVAGRAGASHSASRPHGRRGAGRSRALRSARAWPDGRGALPGAPKGWNPPEPTPENKDRAARGEFGIAHATDEDGVDVGVPINRPATMAEAQHAAEIGACLPNGVMFDYLGNPRKRYTRVSLDGAHLILDDVQLAEHKADATDADQYTYTDVYLSQEEADALPEFDGF